MLTLSCLFASFLIFVFGMYVGKEVQSQKTVHTAQPLRVPVVLSKTGLLARESAATSSIRPTPASLPLTNFIPRAAPAVLPAWQEKTRPKPPTRKTNQVLTSDPLPKKVVKKAGKKPFLEPGKASVQRPNSPKAPPVRAVASSAPARSVSSPLPSASKPEKKLAAKAKGWSVQVQATTQQAAAEQTATRLKREGYASSISKIVRQGQVLYRVRVGPFVRESDAKAEVSRFRRERTFAQAYPVSN